MARGGHTHAHISIQTMMWLHWPIDIPSTIQYATNHKTQYHRYYEVEQCNSCHNKGSLAQCEVDSHCIAAGKKGKKQKIIINNNNNNKSCSLHSTLY